MNRLSVLFFAMFVIVAATAAYQWPVKDVVLTATFGESRWTHFHNGIDLGGGEQDINPIDDGEVVFRFEEKYSPSALPSGLGSFMVIEHNQRIRSLYAHLKSGSMNRDEAYLTKKDTLGVIGETGGSYGKHLHLTIIDSDYKKIINPLIVLPARVDTRRPEIDGIFLEDNGEKRSLVSGMEISSGTYPLHISVYDISEDVSYWLPMAPYGIFLYINGQEIVNFTFESIREIDGKNVLLQTDGKTFDQMYIDDWTINVGSINFLPGETVLDCIVTDNAGNETVTSYKLQVNS